MKVEDRRSKICFYTFDDLKTPFTPVNNTTEEVAYTLGFDCVDDFICFVCGNFGEYMSGNGLANLVLGYISRATLLQVYNLISLREDLTKRIKEQMTNRYRRTVETERNIRKEPGSGSRAQSQLRALGIIA